MVHKHYNSGHFVKLTLFGRNSFLPADTPVLADGLRLAAALPVGGEELAAIPTERLVVLAGVELGRGTHAPEFTGKQ